MCPPSRSQILVERRNSCLPTKVCTATSWVMSKVSDTFATLSGHAALPPILGNLMLGQVDGAESRFLDVVDPARSRVGILLALHYGFVVHCWFCLLSACRQSHVRPLTVSASGRIDGSTLHIPPPALKSCTDNASRTIYLDIGTR